jgi:flagellin
MSLRITQNIEAQTATRHLQATSERVSKSMARLSSGYRINSAADDAAGLGISEAMRSQIRGLAQAQKNIQDGVSMMQTAEGNLDEVHSMLQRVRELAVQYKNASLDASAQSSIEGEISQLGAEITRIGTSASFNNMKLLDDTNASTFTFQVGANDTDTIGIAVVSLGDSISMLDFSNVNSLLTDSAALSHIDQAIGAVSSQRATFGAVQNRLEHTLSVQASYQENLTAAESRIRDVDMAEEMVNLTKNQILSQAGTAMLSQANQAPQSVLKLLQ